MLKILRLKLIKILLKRKDISTILITLGITKDEYINRYNNPEHDGYKSELLKNMCADLERLQNEFALMLDIENYNTIMNKNTIKQKN